MDFVILLRNLKVHGANAIAGFTWGFPAITHFLGYTHALQRRLPKKFDLSFDGCGVVCHRHQVHAHNPSPYADARFSLSRNPLDKSGKSASFVEEGKMNMEVTVLISVTENQQVDSEEKEELTAFLLHQSARQRLAGGVLTNTPTVEIADIQDEKHRKKLLRSLLPGFALVSRHDLLLAEQDRQRQANAPDPDLAAWLSFSSLRYAASQEKTKDGKTPWQQVSSKPGWIKPVAVGYRRISPLYEPGAIAKTRDASSPACFVENVYSLGQWLSPHRITNLNHLFWRPEYAETGTYLCRNQYRPAIEYTDEEE
ncbi:MAG: type I-F CRISPR-associated protein Csy2 [Desulfurellaceae bacterium]|nr:type I-F CRISPR-associated protein Csy2 [Desulfurellaceae bacterium]